MVRESFALDINGIHGIRYWARVHSFGARLAEVTGSDPLVLALFALFHDSRRRNDGRDPGHGKRGADLARASLPSFSP
jgi:uncharacterized protein